MSESIVESRRSQSTYKPFPMSHSPSGRLVWNHSTHLPGLIAILERLVKYAGIHTVTPGVLGSARANSPHLKVKVSVPIRGGFKLIARKGKTFQEVFVLTSLSQEELEQVLEQIIHS
jgi:hypothetical protein